MPEAKHEFGYVESAQQLVHPAGKPWDQRTLLRAAEASQLRNTGWPIGVVLTRSDKAPKVTKDGIEARIKRDWPDGGLGWEDYWFLRTDGSYYVARILEEQYDQPSFQTSDGHPSRPLWFDVRIWRIAELLLHSASLYRALGIVPDEPYLLSINHGGLRDREFWTASSGRFIRRGQISSTDEATWQREVTQDYVVGNLKSLVAEVAKALFVLFDFASVEDDVVAEIVDAFLRRGS